MSLAGHGPKSGSSHISLIMAWTGQQGLVQYKEDKAFNVVFRQPEGGPAEAGDLFINDIFIQCFFTSSYFIFK